MKHLRESLDFIRTIEGIKSVTRTAWTGTGRQESTAEHSFRLALLALTLLDEFPELDARKVLSMCLIHDLGELYTGDIPAIFNTDPQQKSDQEYEDICRIFHKLPEPMRSEFLSLWKEYNSNSSPEAHLVKALDKAETILQHNQGQNPPDFNYAFNLTYGASYFEGDPRLKDQRHPGCGNKSTYYTYTKKGEPYPMIQIIISPAKKMNLCEEFPGSVTTPVFQKKTDSLYQILKTQSAKELQALWKCSEKLTLQNVQRLQEFTPDDAATPAVLAYEGIQYQYLAPGIFSDAQWDYVRQHLNILSGFYGILRPSDAVIPYRLEMQAKLQTAAGNDLYRFWGDQLYQALYQKFDPAAPKELINLASTEYSKAIVPYVTEDVHCITCIFGEWIKEKVKVKATLAKMARGEMVRWMAEQQIQTTEELKQFTGLGFAFEESLSSGTEYVFLKKAPCPEDSF